jgi:hypothetical protein
MACAGVLLEHTSANHVFGAAALAALAAAVCATTLRGKDAQAT